MDQELRKLIKFELCSYMRNKDVINQMQIFDLVAHRQLLRSAVIVHVIESALIELPQEIKEYAELKYFNKSGLGYSMLSSKCNVSERTVKRWDETLLKTVAEHLESIKNLALSGHFFGTKLEPSALENLLEYKQQENHRARYILVVTKVFKKSD